MKLLITGVSHKTAPVEVRECLAFREETLPAALADLKSREGVSEAVILSFGPNGTGVGAYDCDDIYKNIR